MVMAAAAITVVRMGITTVAAIFIMAAVAAFRAIRMARAFTAIAVFAATFRAFFLLFFALFVIGHGHGHEQCRNGKGAAQ